MLYDFPHVVPVPGPVTGVNFQEVSDSEILVNWREPEVTNGRILRYNIIVTLHSTGQTVYTNVVSAGGGLSDMVTRLGKMHGNLLLMFHVLRCSLTFFYCLQDQTFLQLFV